MKKQNKLFEYFAGEYVSVLLNKTAFQSIQHGSNIKNIQSQTVEEGYLVDEDDVHYYLGSEPTHISCAIQKAFVMKVDVVDPTSIDEELFNALVDGPGSENEVN